MTTANNYDTSSTGLNLELSAFYDVDLAQLDFDQCFNVLQAADFRKPSILVFNGWGDQNVNEWDPSGYENWDLSETTVKEMISELIKTAFDITPDYSGVKDILIDLNNYDILPLRDASKEDLFNSIREYLEDAESLTEYAEKIGSPTFAEIKIYGYSQGDVSYIYVPQPVLKDRGLTVDDVYKLRDELRDLIYGAPVYARLAIDNDSDEIYLYELLTDNYRWDRGEVLQNIDLSRYNADQQKIIMEFLENNLPFDLDYR